MKNKKGISLIVLIITILVMIIIAAAIILNIDDSKIIKNADKAVTANNVSAAKEVVTVARAEWRTNKEKILDEGFTSFKEYAESKLEEAGFEIGTNGGQVQVKENGLLYAYIEPVIPEGFIASDISTEDEVSEGLVIYEGYETVSTDADAQTTRNQYVWVPVPNMGEFVRKDGYYGGALQTYVSGGTTTEPFSKGTLTETNDLTGEYAEYAKMRASVAKYGGFYIARYEAGTSVQRTDIANGTSADILSQKDKYPYNYVGWGPSMTSVIGDVTYSSKNQGKGAVELARSIYPESANKDVVSTLCYGVQWDAAMNFMKDVKNPNGTKSEYYIYDSINMGWYSNNKSNNAEYKTGIDVDTNKSNMVKNIYDMAGNVREWTMEASSTSIRVLRGGYYTNIGSSYPASNRNYLNPLSAISSIGFRFTLYVK